MRWFDRCCAASIGGVALAGIDTVEITEGGIQGVPQITWGSHYCHFYDSREELLDVLSPFFAAGLRNNEACLWLTAEPLSASAARAALLTAVPDLASREHAGQIEIVDLEEWYHRTGPIDASDAWIKRKEVAEAHGFAGLRLSSNVVEHVPDEPPIEGTFDDQRIVALFSYSLRHCSSADVLGVASRHQFTLARRASISAMDGDAASSGGDGVGLQRRTAEEVRAEQELRGLDRRKSEFFGVLGHELRNPLASILTASQLMALRGGEQQFRKELDIIQRQVSNITVMVDELLDMSRIVGGRIDLEFGDVDITDAISRGIEIATPVVVKRAHRLHVSSPPAGLAVHGDAARLAQVVAHLLTNAARYTAPGGDITVAAERRDGQVTLTVTDTGEGIEPGRLGVLFEPFVLSRDERRRAGGGLGLELPIARSLVELHGGTVEAASAPGQGSRFVVRLPALDAVASAH
jgi:signal transduction histidine kinase